MPALSLFEGFGVELEYMIVDRDSLDVRAAADELIRLETGQYVSSVDRGPIEWSNELALHVIELKTNGPAPDLAGLDEIFQKEVNWINQRLASLNATLMPTAMHPWMDPFAEARLWPHEYNAVYEAFHRIFDCRGHGWSNLQSVHLNLPFQGDDEFARLHAAIRLVLPLLPALAASSPIQDSSPTGILDSRLNAYRSNAARVPSVSGLIIPETVRSREEYLERILEPIYRDLAPLDPEGVLREEWVNARGAIARFERNTIEIRLLDVQECPAQDLAIVRAVVAVTRALVEERWSSLAAQQALGDQALHAILQDAIRDADRALVADPDYLRALGGNGSPCRADDLWRRLTEQILPSADSPESDRLRRIQEKGTVARRVLRALGPQPTRASIQTVYRRLTECLRDGEAF